MSIFRSAITDADGKTVNVGYLSLFFIAAGVLGAIPAMVIGAFVQQYFSPFHIFDMQGLGAGIGFACGGFATSLGALGAFVRLDRGPGQMPGPSP